MIEQIIYLLENYGKTFLKGLGATLLLAICGTLFGLLIGILIAVIRNNKVLPTDSTIKKILKRIGLGITYVYITVLRGTPMMVQALIIYFGGKMIGIPWNSTELGKMFIDGHLVCGLFVITLNTAAYMAENVRAGINAIDPGQMEASRALGMTYFETMVHVIIPQALKNAIPNIGNEFIVNIKDSSVLNVITVSELFLSVKIATSNNYYTVAGYVIVAAIYLILTLVATVIVKKIEELTSDRRKVEKLERLQVKE